MIDERIQPFNGEVEDALLSAVLLDGSVMHDIAEIVTNEDFFTDHGALIFAGIEREYHAGRTVNFEGIAYALDRAGTLQRAGGIEKLGELSRRAVHAANAVYHAQTIKELAGRRRLIDALEKSLAECYAPNLSLAELVDETEARVFAVAQEEAGGSTVAMGDLAAQAVERIYRRQAHGDETKGVGSGFPELDMITDGFQPATLVVLAALTSIGKSALALNIAENAAVEQRTGVLFVSLEMAGIELGERLVVSRSQIDGGRARRGRWMSDEDRDDLDRARDDLRDSGLFWVDDAPGRTLAQIAANARRYKSRHDIGLLIIDYLQLITVSKDLQRRSRQEQVADTSRRLKMLSRELQIPILALAQLNRETMKRADKKPQLSDLRESGSIEQDADLVLLLNRPDKFNPLAKPGVAELEIAKHRAGACGMVELLFHDHQTRFESMILHPGF